MAESVVSFLINKLASFVEEETKLLGGVRKEVVFVKNELERMKAFLRKADEMEESDPGIQVMVKQVREVAYDTEDVLDQFMLRLEHRHGHGFVASLRMISSSANNLKARRWIASEIEDIKTQIQKIFDVHQRYSDILNDPEKGSSSTARTDRGCDSRDDDALLLDEAELVGIDEPKNQLIELLLQRNPELKAVSVVGMGGLGKTTLVKKVFDDATVRTHFQSHAWITVSQSFKMEELLKDVIRELFGETKEPVPEGMETMNSQKLKQTLKTFLGERRYVLVLDDIWNVIDWDAFQNALPDSNCGSRVMLTTRIGEVASKSCIDFHGTVYEMKPLSEKESRTLFCRRTFREDHCPRHLVELSEGLLQRCQRLPLAIKVISGVLATKNPTIDEWKMIEQSLGVELEGNDGFKLMKRILLLSYNDLPFNLKYCFLYLSIFPEDHSIERMRLIRLWIAEGFVEVKKGRTPEEVADGYLNQLINRSLIQVAETTIDGRVKQCRIHDLLREIILSKSEDQNLVTIAGEQKSTWPEKVRRLSVHNSWGNVQENKNISRLRSLLMFGMVDSLPNSFMLSLCGGSSLRLLKVLDLRRAPLDAFPDEITKLFHLRYLSLRDTKVKMLPSSIGKLQNLQTLDLKHTDVTELPVEVSQLPRLRHLLVYGYLRARPSFHGISGFKAPTGIGGLLCLQKLCFIEANEGSGILIKEMGMLVQLRRLGIINLRREDGLTLCSSIEKMSNLRSLSVASVEKDEIIDLQHLFSPPQLLQRVYLRGRLEKLPHWIPSLHGLVRLYLLWSRLRDDPLESLGALPNLVELVLEEAYDGEILCFKARGFQSLKELTLERLEALRVVRVEEGSMPNLERVSIWGCKLLERVPSDTECLTTKYGRRIEYFFYDKSSI